MNILVVEDQDSIRRMIEALVSARGHAVTAVPTRRKALEVAGASPPDVVLLDLNLPGRYDGYEVCRRLRAEAATADVPVIIISALDTAESRAKAHDAGATAYFTKPFSPMALLKEVDAIATRARA